MSSMPQYDPLSTEIISTFLAGMSEGLNKLSTALNCTTSAVTDAAMSEVYIGTDDRYRIYQVAAGNRLWLSDPAPVIKKNGSVISTITDGFTIDYVGGAIIFESASRLTVSDTVTVSMTRIASGSTEINDIKSDVTALESITAHFLGYYASVSDLQTAHTTGSDGDFAIIGGSVDSIYMWDSTGSAWKDIYKTVDLSTYYTKTEANALLANKEGTIAAHGSDASDDDYYYGGRKTWIELAAKARAVVLTGIDTATSAIITASDTVLGALGKLQAQIAGKPFLTLTGDPTTSTVGTVGQRAVNESSGAVFRCTSTAGSVYTWVKQGSTSDLVDSNVTNAKLANMANNTIKGNVSGSSAAPSDLTVAQVRGIITEGTSEVDAIADGDKFVIEDVSATAGVRTKHVLWSAIKAAQAEAASTNLIINGGFDVWQRGTSQTATGYGSDDRWGNAFSNSAKTHSLETFVVGQTEVLGNPINYSRSLVTTSNASNAINVKYQNIEDVTRFSGKQVTVSFWAKADSIKNIAIEFLQQFGVGGSESVTGLGVTKFALTSIWQKFTATVALPSISGKTIGTSNNLQFRIWFEAGSNYAVRTDSLGNQSGTFDIANVQLNYGSVALPFVPRSFAEELRLCQRYYEKSYDVGTAPGSGYYTSGCHMTTTVAADIGAGVRWVLGSYPRFKVGKRIAPTITLYTLDGLAGSWFIATSGRASRADFISENGFVVVNNTGGSITTSVSEAYGHWVADAEL